MHTITLQLFAKFDAWSPNPRFSAIVADEWADWMKILGAYIGQHKVSVGIDEEAIRAGTIASLREEIRDIQAESVRKLTEIEEWIGKLTALPSAGEV